MARTLAISIVAAALLALAAQAALAHPHAGGIVVKDDGTVVVGDVLGSRLLIIEPSGDWRAVPAVRGVRDIELASDGTLYGVSQSQGLGLWKLDENEQPVPIVGDFYGLFALGDDGKIFLAPADAQDRRLTLEVRSHDGERSSVVGLSQIEALTWHDGSVLVADGSTIRRVSPNGNIEVVEHDGGEGLYGLVWGENGAIVSVYGGREVVELPADGTRRVLLTSEPPWAPTDLAIHDGMLYVVEVARHPCCWKGPRVRRIALNAKPDTTPETLLVIDDQSHTHLMPWDRPLQWLVGGLGLTTLALFGAFATVRKLRGSKSASSASRG